MINGKICLLPLADCRRDVSVWLSAVWMRARVWESLGVRRERWVRVRTATDSWHLTACCCRFKGVSFS